MGNKFFDKFVYFPNGKKSKSKFTDIRLDMTCNEFINAVTTRYSCVLRTLGEDYNQETRFANFIRNPKVTPNRILEHHWKSINTEWTDKQILVISDTSNLSFPFRSDREEMNFVGANTDLTGFDIHPSILVDSQNGALYGLGGLQILPARYGRDKLAEAIKKGGKRNNDSIPFEEKDRYKWFSSPSQAVELSPTAAGYTFVGDRDSDIYELMTKTLEHGHNFLYRSKHNRTLSTGTQKLYETIDEWEVKDYYEIDVCATKKRTAHQATVSIKYGSVSIQRPPSHKNRLQPKSITLQVVEVKEIPSSVIGDEPPVHWVLLTSHPITSVEQAKQIIQWYCQRWIIEEVFRGLKSKGLNIESSEVETFHGLCNLTTLALIASIQLMQMVNARDGQTNQEVKNIFFETEQQTLILLNQKLQKTAGKTVNPFNENSLSFASWIIARLGGWKGRPKERLPGPITMKKGLIRFYNILEGVKLLI